jgi:hypothetical protein
MATMRGARGNHDRGARPSLRVLPETIPERTPVEVRGENWPDAVITVAIGGEAVKITVVAGGEPRRRP